MTVECFILIKYFDIHVYFQASVFDTSCWERFKKEGRDRFCEEMFVRMERSDKEKERGTAVPQHTADEADICRMALQGHQKDEREAGYKRRAGMKIIIMNLWLSNSKLSDWL